MVRGKEDDLKVAVVADLIEEGWPSMDLVADMLMAHLGRDGVPVTPLLMRPSFRGGLPFWPGSRDDLRPPALERIARRFWTYPRWLRRQGSADIYHIVDHSYAHLANELPAGRVVTTCHDTDAFRTLLHPEQRDSRLPAVLVRRVLRGLRRSAVVVCDSEAARVDIVESRLVPVERTVVVPLGVHPSCSAAPDPVSDQAAESLTGPAGSCDLLHVGSTAPRKRIDTLVEILARVARVRADATLWRVGGPFTAAQAARVEELGIAHRIRVLPFVNREILAAVYRRASLVLLPSDREGFGLPIAEALACGTPVIASDVPVLREVGGTAVEYCAAGDPAAWCDRVLRLLDERGTNASAWAARRAAGRARASLYSWSAYASSMEQLYLNVSRAGAAGTERERVKAATQAAVGPHD
jgi:glycosyltransferase involved in cell wall biosynthesis